MEGLFQKAKRSKSYLKIGVAGVSGSGKTYGALLLARGLLGGSLDECVVIDTENGSANLYDSLGNYSVVDFAPPFHPERYAKIIGLAVDEGFKCIIIDSTSHEWDGEGGCLDLQTKFGGRFQDWAKVTPLHKKFLDAILQSKAHVICCTRKKSEYAVDQSGGKTKVMKMGVKDVQRDGFEYELTVAFEITTDHIATSTKDRTGLFPNTQPFTITEETGKQLKEWNEGK
jgi:hypothetical protein